MKINFGKLLKAGIKVAGPLAPVVIGILTAKATGAIEKQADKLIDKAKRK